MNIIVIPNKAKDVGLTVTKSLLSALRAFDCSVTVCETVPERTGAELCVVLGGDGTLMRAARKAAPFGIPILGINLGRVGYLAELEPGELDLLDGFFKGEYTIEERMMLSVEIPSEGIRTIALNDAVISHGMLSRMAEIELYRGGSMTGSFRADGLIFATPTGSTAYSLSAGGPVIDPELECICVTPICSHSLRARPLIFSPTTVLGARSGETPYQDEAGVKLYLTVDGSENYSLSRGTEVRVTRSETVTRLVRLKKYNFYRVLNQKMSD